MVASTFAAMRLSEHFTLGELIFSSTAQRLGIDNEPPPNVLGHLYSLAQGLERARFALNGMPIHIDSGYRSPALNAIVGGAKNSAHLDGDAADFICPPFGSPLVIVHFLAVQEGFRFDQLIQEGSWVHISFAPALRGEILTATFKDGKATYEPWRA